MAFRKAKDTPKLNIAKSGGHGSKKTIADSFSQQIAKPTGQTTEEEYGHLKRNEQEIEELAKQIGIDYETERNKYLWFLIQISNLDLPPEWVREEDGQGNIVYLNSITNYSTNKHPLIPKFRHLFMEILENEDIGKARLLEMKTKSKLYLNNEARIQAKQNTKAFKRFKAAANAIVVGSTLSNKIMNKGQVEKNAKMGSSDQQKLIEPGKALERFEKIRKVLHSRREHFDKKMNEIDNLESSEYILEDCKQFYRREFGAFNLEVTKKIEEIEAYQSVGPIEMVEAAKLFRVRSNQPYVFWCLRAYCSLPLPSYWNKLYDPELRMEIFVSMKDNIRITVRPCFTYISETIEHIKKVFKENAEKFVYVSTRMTLNDQLGRSYEIEMAHLIRELVENTKMDGSKKPQASHFITGNERDEDNPTKSGMRKTDFNANHRDAHFIEIASQAGIDLNKDIHLLMFIEEFVKDREHDEKWFFRQAADGNAFWINHEKKKAVKEYPHLAQVKSYVERKKEILEVERDKYMKKEHALLQTLFRKMGEEEALNAILKESQKFVEFYLANKEQANDSAVEAKSYNLASFIENLAAQLPKTDLLDLVFYCPFDFSYFTEGSKFASSEAILLKKLKQSAKGPSNTNGEGGHEEELVITDEDLQEHMNRIQSQLGNQQLYEDTDEAKEIRQKIEDSKRLFDLAANVKDVDIDPEKKREFLKLMIDFEEKYGTFDDEDDEDGSDDGDDDETTPGGGKKKNKSFSSGKGRKKGTKKLTQSKIKGDSTSKSKLSQSKEITEEGDDNEEIDGPLGKISTKSRSKTVKNLKNLTTSNKKNISDHSDVTPKRRSDTQWTGKSTLTTSSDKHGSGVLRSSQGKRTNKSGKNVTHDGDEDDESGDISGTRKKTPKTNKSTSVRSGKKKKSTRRQGSGDDELGYNDEEEGDEEEFDDDDEIIDSVTDDDTDSEGRDDVNEMGQSGKKRKKGRKNMTVKTLKGLNEKKDQLSKSNKDKKSLHELSLELDKLGKSSRGTVSGQLGETSEQSRRQTTGKGTKRSSKGGTVHGDDFSDESLAESVSPNISMLADQDNEANFEDLRVVHQEITTEDGETEIVPIAMKVTNNKVKPKKAQSISPNKRREFIKKKRPDEDDPDTKSDEESIEVMMDENGRPVIVSSKQRNEKGKLAERVPSGGLEPGKWEKDASGKLIERISVPDLDGQVSKKQIKKEMEGQLLDLFQKSVGKDLQEGSDPRNRGQSRGRYEINSGDPLAMTQGQFGIGDFRNTGIKQSSKAQLKRTAFEILQQKNSSIFPQTEFFYTPFQQYGRKTEEYYAYLASIVFMKKLDMIVLDFLINQFAEVQEKTLGLKYDKENPAFRAQFKKTYRKLLQKLKNKLVKNQDFINNVYSKVHLQTQGVKNDAVDSMLSRTMEKGVETDKSAQPEIVGQSIVNPHFVVPTTPSDKESPLRLREEKSSSSPQRNLLNTNRGIPVHSKMASTTTQLPKVHSDANIRNIEQMMRTGMPNQKSMAYLKSKQTMQESMNINKNMFDDSKFRGSQESYRNLFYDGPDESSDDEDDQRSKRSVLEKSGLRSVNKSPQSNVSSHLREANSSAMSPQFNLDRANFGHYWKKLGDPIRLDAAYVLSKVTIPEKVQPYHIVLMCQRLGIRMEDNQEVDLAWIGYLHLICKGPAEWDIAMSALPKDKMFQKISYTQAEMHPGDRYFKTVASYHQAKRAILMEKMNEHTQRSYMRSQSWLKLKYDNGRIYYFNFMTKQKSETLPSEFKEASSVLLGLMKKEDARESIRELNNTILFEDPIYHYFKTSNQRNL